MKPTTFLIIEIWSFSRDFHAAMQFLSTHVLEIFPLSVIVAISPRELACWIIWPSGNIALHIDVLVVHFLDSFMMNSLCHSIFKSLKNYINLNLNCPQILTVLSYSSLSDTCGKSKPVIFFSILKWIYECLGRCSKIVHCPCLSSFNISTKFTFIEVSLSYKKTLWTINYSKTDAGNRRLSESAFDVLPLLYWDLILSNRISVLSSVQLYFKEFGSWTLPVISCLFECKIKGSYFPLLLSISSLWPCDVYPSVIVVTAKSPFLRSSGQTLPNGSKRPTESWLI